MNFKQLRRQGLGFFPTPLHELRQLGKKLGGPRILIKRDDMTGLAMGGNKVRKLEFLLGDALAQGCDTLITGGALQSNHCRQTAGAAAACGLECHLVLGGEPPAEANGNYLLDRLLGAEVHWAGELRKGERIPEITAELRHAGRTPYAIPYGGSNAVGATGFVEAVRELLEQLKNTGEEITHIVFPSSSGGTHAGLTVGRSMFRQNFRIVGIAIDKGEAGEGPFDEHVADLANRTSEKLNVECRFRQKDITLRNDYLGEGYGVVGDLERRAIALAAETEGVFLDPVYTGRAMGALIDMIARKEFSSGETVLFWHTGGSPALFSYAQDLIL